MKPALLLFSILGAACLAAALGGDNAASAWNARSPAYPRSPEPPRCEIRAEAVYDFPTGYR